MMRRSFNVANGISRRLVGVQRRLYQNFSENVFDMNSMKETLPKDAYKKYRACVENSEPLDMATADVLATAVKSWAIEHGVTHYSHQFQPMTNVPAEKHDAFLEPHVVGKLDVFSGKRMLFGETDGSSFPSGGLRVTHQARGYTTWDPAASPYISTHMGDPVLIIPCIFYSWKGHALDRKIPHLRSEEALKQQTLKLFSAAGIRKHKKVHTDCGIEQEFFLLNQDQFLRRPDLQICGRTLQGRHPAKGQEMNDSYFGVMTSAALDCIHEMEEEAWKLGIPVVTRHREVCPNQYEVAPIFEKSPKASDHNVQLMELMDVIARRHNLACLFHEKPFAHVNGSGKHNNWSIGTNVTGTLFDPGKSPDSNLEFLLAVAAVIRGADMNPELLRWCISGAGNDHRLGGHEAPPAVISIYVGSMLSSMIDSIANQTPWSMPSGTKLNLGIPHLPTIVADSADRNRTSPFAFTGNKFEVRAVGSSQNPADSNTVLNVLVADSFRAMERDIRAKTANGESPKEAAMAVVRETFKKHRRILFEGDGYSADWLTEAARRGLPNLPTTPDAIDAVANSQKSRDIFSSLGVLHPEEFDARNSIMYERYANTIAIEANVLASMSHQAILPVALNSQNRLGQSVSFGGNGSTAGHSAALGALSNYVSDAFERTAELNNIVDQQNSIESEAERARFAVEKTLASMANLRESLDAIEGRVDQAEWPFPDYQSLMFERH